jgi:hypothetical protein
MRRAGGGGEWGGWRTAREVIIVSFINRASVGMGEHQWGGEACKSTINKRAGDILLLSVSSIENLLLEVSWWWNTATFEYSTSNATIRIWMFQGKISHFVSWDTYLWWGWAMMWYGCWNFELAQECLSNA